MSEIYIDIFGWIGSILLVTAYALISNNKIKADSYFYQIFNVIGSIALILNTYHYSAYPSTFVNAVWLAIGAVAIFKIGKKLKKNLSNN